MPSITSRIPLSAQLVLLALFAAIALGALPSVARAAACPGADPCPWTQIDTFGDVGHGEFRAPFGVATDAGGNLYVIENDTHRVQKLDPTGAYLGEWGSFGSAEREFKWAYDIAVDVAHDAVYVTDTSNYRIQKFDTNGNFVAAWGWGVDDGSAAYQVCTSGCQQGLAGSGAGQLKRPRGLATDGTNVYVADRGNKRIQKYGLDGSLAGSWTVGSPAQEPERVAVAAGKVYVTTSQNRLWRSDTAGAPDNTWDGDGVTGASGTGAGQLDYPGAIAVDGTGAYVVDANNARIDRFDTSGTFVSAWGWGVKDGASAFQTCTSTCRAGIAGTGVGQFDDPYGMVVTGGKVWVADSYNHRLQQFTPAGAHLATVGGLPGGEFYFPEDVAVAPSGAVYVADYSAGRMQRLSAAGAFESMWNLQYPLGVIATAGGVYATSANTVTRFDATGSVLGKWGGPGGLPGQLNWPWGSAADAAGNIYVADSNNDRVQKFDPSGNPLAVIGSAGSGDGQLKQPRDVAVDRAGNVYVADTGNNRVEKFDAAGGFLGAWGGAGSADGQFSAPSGIAVDGSGDVFVSDLFNNRIQRFDADGHFISKWGVNGTGAGQLFEPLGIAVGHSGELWVADSSNHRIVRFCCPATPVSPDPAGPSGTPSGPSGTPSGPSGTPSGPSGEPGSGPAADTVAPHIALTGRRVQRTGAVRRRGLTLRIRSDEPAGFRIAATISRRSARRLGLATPAGARRVTIGRASADLATAGGRRLRVRLGARARRALARIGSRPLAVVVRASAADRAGNRTTGSFGVRITR
jgi:tripartite motif-containing protein 71